MKILLALSMIAMPITMQAQQPIRLWPNGAPGQAPATAAEKDNTKPTDNKPGNRPVIRLTNVTDPTITVFSPKGKANGKAVIVCPGGGYSILAIDLEGTEVCEYLNTLGITAVLLKYRVPAQPGQPRYQAPLQDAQRAIGWIRYHAADYHIDPNKVGIMGFSAGGHLSAAVANNYETRTYPHIDESDNVSCRPDFTILIYPAYLTLKEDNDRLAPEIKVTPHTPPAFIVQTADDPIRVENAIFYALALKNEKVKAELHIYPTGGHGYGMRTTIPWVERLKEWLAN